MSEIHNEQMPTSACCNLPNEQVILQLMGLIAKATGHLALALLACYHSTEQASLFPYSLGDTPLLLRN